MSCVTVIKCARNPIILFQGNPHSKQKSPELFIIYESILFWQSKWDKKHNWAVGKIVEGYLFVDAQTTALIFISIC